ncbi:MAG: holo-ACP synthase [Gammaproteobacteria bacterium]|nr:holo-ACP synthase [Gammaproteobacteria bacterium]MBI5783624.1 holo-ACP synthase [Gammaproteobacteria bacterium]
MIFGIGTDIVRVARMQEDLDRFGDRFAERILTVGELQEFHQNASKANFLARRFAAKEAAVKALGTGFSHGVQLRDIEVTHDEQGKPLLEFSGRAREFLQEKKISIAHISLADEKDHAVAFVTLETC